MQQLKIFRYEYEFKTLLKIFNMRLLILTILSLFLATELVADDRQDERGHMVDMQIKGRGVSDDAVLEAMRTVPRHKLVPDDQQARAYDDNPLPIGYGQTISQPYIVATMTEKLELEPGDRVLEIGAGSGYHASVIAQIVDEVYTIEIIEELGNRARRDIESLNYDNIEVKIADGYYGWEEHAPFDAIVVTAAAEYIPPPLIEQLKEDGKMIIPVGSPYRNQNLMLVEKVDGEKRTQSLMPVRFVPFEREN